MNLRDEAKRRLAEYRWRSRAVERLPEEIRRLEIKAQKLGSAPTDREPVQGGGSTQEEGVLENLEARELLGELLRDNLSLVESVEETMKVLPEEEQEILRALVIEPDNGGAERLCETMGVQKSRLYRRLDESMDHFTVAMFGWEK